MKPLVAFLAISLSRLVLAVPDVPAQQPRASAPANPRYTITLGARSACVTPHSHIRARADGGIIEVQVSAHGSDTLSATMTGTPAKARSPWRDEK